MTPELALYLVGIFGTILGLFMKGWVEGVNKRLGEGNKTFEEIKERLVRVEERCKFTHHEHEGGDSGNAEI